MEITVSRPPDWEWSPSVGTLAGALAAAQGQIENAAKGSINPFFKSKYADLAEVIAAIRGPLSEAGIARHQGVFMTDGQVGVRTTLIHSSGEWLASTVWCPFEGGPQDLGKIVTYLRRYSLSAAVGIAQEDDDGNAAQASVSPIATSRAKAPEPAPPPAPPVKLPAKTQARIKILQTEAQIPDTEWREKLHQYYGVSSSTELTEAQAADLISKLEARKRDVGGREPVSPTIKNS